MLSLVLGSALDLVLIISTVQYNIHSMVPWDCHKTIGCGTCHKTYNYCFYFCGAVTQHGSWPLHSWGSQITHDNAPQLVGLLWTSDQLIAETSTWQHTTLNNRQISVLPVGFEPMISAGEQPQTYALDRAATGTGKTYNYIDTIQCKIYIYNSHIS